MPRPEFTDPAVTDMDAWRIAQRASQQAIDAIGREIARQRDAGASDDVLAALDAAMCVIPAPAFPKASRS
jgi:hypothetical protein